MKYPKKTLKIHVISHDIIITFKIREIPLKVHNLKRKKKKKKKNGKSFNAIHNRVK